MNRFPLYVDLSEKEIRVFGGGRIAERRVLTLLSFAQRITVISPEITERLAELNEAGRIRWIPEPYCRRYLKNADIVLAATDDEGVNSQVYTDCKQNNIIVNNAGNQAECDFHFPGILEAEGIVIGFNGGGRDHRKTREMRSRVERLLKETGEQR